jgi:hypothetical protein
MDELLLHQAQRRAVLAVVRRSPSWTLAQLCSHIDRRGERAAALGSLTIGELRSTVDPPDGEPPIHYKRLALAQRSHGETFDRVVHEVLVEAGKAVAAAYLRARVGGPRWKLQSSLRRLAGAGLVERRGATSDARYLAVAGVAS